MVAKTKKVNLVRIDDGVPDKGAHVNPMYGKYIKYFPTFMLVTYNSWMGNRELEGAIMNQIMGHYEGKNFVPTIPGKGIYGYIAEDVFKWIDKEMTTNPIFNANVPPKMVVDEGDVLHRLKDLSLEKDKINHRGREVIKMGFESDSE